MSGIERHRIVIIGAGSSGLCTAIHLKKAGIEDFVILEKGTGVGGTWYHNTYPGAECDVQSHLYQFSFEQKNDWSKPYGGQAEILEYLNHCFDKYEVRPYVRFGTAVTTAEWQDDDDCWLITTDSGKQLEAQVLVSGLGMFNDLKWPTIPGIDDFEGEYFHSARWNHDIDLTGKRIGVIGLAASAIQFTPELAKVAGQLTLYQRTANWVVPKGNTPHSEETLAKFRANPELVTQSRAEIYDGWNTLCTFNDKKILSGLEDAGMENIGVVTDPELRQKLTPHHPFGCKRPLFSDVYYPIFNQDNVELVTDTIERVTAKGIVSGGVERAFDVIVYATGFRTTNYLSSIDVRGAGGRKLADAWSDGPQAYLGVSTAGFPNLFMLYGPNTNQGCILFMLERQVEFILRQLKRMDAENLAWIDIRPDVMAEFNDKLQVALQA
ncbi:MAG: NAD(P)/FAD-dependent oxidoreductase, partial [Rhodospirillales bacterium]|nr:NAD(P)/FAD-dependent oxidoreductase [Rhodospirillales bacterium]